MSTKYKHNNFWFYEDKIFEPNTVVEYAGFCYLIENKIDNRKYIGKKFFWHRRKNKYVESDWKNYYSSSKELKNDIKLYRL